MLYILYGILLYCNGNFINVIYFLIQEYYKERSDEDESGGGEKMR